jgi:hypothetical protein
MCPGHGSAEDLLGINDTPWNRLDDPCGAAPDYPMVEWEAITPSCTARVARVYADVLDQVLAEVDEPAADYTHPSPAGHEAIAALMADAGLEPLA